MMFCIGDYSFESVELFLLYALVFAAHCEIFYPEAVSYNQIDKSNKRFQRKHDTSINVLIACIPLSTKRKKIKKAVVED